MSYGIRSTHARDAMSPNAQGSREIGSQRLLLEVRMVEAVERRRPVARIERQHLGQQIVGVLAQRRAQVARQPLLALRKGVARYGQAAGPLGGRRAPGQSAIVRRQNSNALLVNAHYDQSEVRHFVIVIFQ